MLFPEFKYVEVAFGDIRHRNKVVKITDVQDMLDATNSRECYRSIYRHPREFAKYAKKNNSVSGWDGEVYADILWFDIDDAEKLWKAADSAKNLILRLEKVYEIPPETLWLFFSGCKGFHIGINGEYFGFSPCRELPFYCKSIAQELVGDIKIDGAVYDRTRMLRLANTINGKSELYKIPLTIDDLHSLTIEQIREMAANQRTIPPIVKIVEKGKLAGMMEQMEEKRAKKVSFSDVPLQVRKKALHGQKLCLWRMMQGVDKGIRDESAMRLSCDYAKKGMPADTTHRYMLTWNQANRPPLDEKVIQEKVAHAYGRTSYDFGCNDHILSAFCHEDCFLFKDKDMQDDMPKPWQPSEKWLETVKYLQSTDRIQLAFMPKINAAMRGLGRGEVMVDLARPGVGKSLKAQSLIHDVTKNQDVKAIFFSLEMPADLLLIRAASIESGWSGAAIEEMIIADEYDELTDRINALDGNLLFVDDVGLSLRDMEEVILAEGGVGLVVIDYMSLVRSPGRTIYERTTYVARQLKELAKNTQTAVFMLCQVSRTGGDGTRPITLEMGRDTGAIEEGCDFAVGMWRDNIDPDGTIAVELLKNRRGIAGQKEFLKFDGESARLVSQEVEISAGSRIQSY